jgi:DNA modification methylase
MIVWSDASMTLYAGDCRAVLAGMADESVSCVVTSPPYWGCRDYGAEGQIGSEPTPEAYVAELVRVFDEVRRVLHRRGTLWLVVGDAFAHPGKGASGDAARRQKGTGKRLYGDQANRRDFGGYKRKDLLGLPWLLAFALREAGWWLRADIVWAKTNPVPEPVTDRPVRSHEYVFLLAKSERYFYDHVAVREPMKTDPETYVRSSRSSLAGVRTQAAGRPYRSRSFARVPPGRNLRDVWSIATVGQSSAHTAVFPPQLVRLAIRAGTSERGICPECGAPWRRDRKDEAVWLPSCRHEAEPVPAIVLDPFAGTGTTCVVAEQLGRRSIGIDIRADYLAEAIRRAPQPPLIGRYDGAA